MSEMVRLIRYAELLSNRRFMTKQDLMAKQEVSLATLKRDLAKLRDQMNVPIVFDRDLGGYTLDKTSERTELPGFWFSQDEILALLTIQNMIGELEPGLLGPKLKPLIERRFKQQGDVTTAIGLAAGTDCVLQSYALAEFHAQRAVEALMRLPSSDHRSALLRLLHQALARDK
jgi:predicted DNA-binding transcriptional regulator YafY